MDGRQSWLGRARLPEAMCQAGSSSSVQREQVAWAAGRWGRETPRGRGIGEEIEKAK